MLSFFCEKTKRRLLSHEEDDNEGDEDQNTQKYNMTQLQQSLSDVSQQSFIPSQKSSGSGKQNELDCKHADGKEAEPVSSPARQRKKHNSQSTPTPALPSSPMTQEDPVISQVNHDDNNDDEKMDIDNADIEGDYYTTFINQARESLQKELDNLNLARQQADERPLESRVYTSHIPEKYKRYKWPDSVPMKTKIDFLKQVGLLSMDVPAKTIAQYLLTWEELNMRQNAVQMVELAFSEDPIKMEEDTRINFAFCDTIEVTAFRGTPFEDLDDDLLGIRIHRLTQLHEENVLWFRLIEASKDARANGRPLPPFCAPPSIDNDMFANPGRDELKEKPHQQLLEFLFDIAGSKHLRRTESSVYRCRTTPEGYNTRCYEYDMDIAPWIARQVTPKSLYPQQYAAYTEKPGTPKYLADHMGSTPDLRFPFLVRCRTLWSFRNCIFNSVTNQVYVYADSEISLGKNILSVSQLPSNVSTAKYFDTVIPLHWFKEGFDYKTIEVPLHEKIFSDQGYNDEEIDWVESLCGRLQHDIGTMQEDWQIALFFEGPGKTGKSVFLKLIALWYLTMDIGLIGDDVEKTFSDQHLIGKFIVMCMDISGDFALSPTRFLSWVSGEWLIVMRKFKEAIAVKWAAPTLFASNSKPPIATSGGAGPRRWIIMKIMKAIQKSDGTLFARASKEVPFFIIKCAMGYHDKIKQHGNQGLWDSRGILPDRFWDAREEYTRASSWPDAFLHSGLFEVDTGSAIDESDFKRQFLMFREREKHLQGVNSKRTVANVQCTPMEFANALNDFPIPAGQKKPPPDEKEDFKLYWNTETGRIVGLRWATDASSDENGGWAAAAAPARAAPTSARNVPQPTVVEGAFGI